jgi:hypothetical protein
MFNNNATRYDMRKLLFAAALAALLLLSMPAGARRASAEETRIKYRVDLGQPETGLVEVTMEVESTSESLVLEALDSYGDGLAVDLASHIEQEEARDSSGNTLTVRRDGNTWYIEGTGNISFSYQVDISGYQAGTEYLDSLAASGAPWPFFPLLDEELAYLPGYAVFAYPRDGNGYVPEVQLELPQGWVKALPWVENPGGMEDLLYNPIYAGGLALQEQDSLLVAVPSSSAAASGIGLEEYAEKARLLLSETENMLGGLELQEGQRLLIAALLIGEGEEMIEMYYPSTPFSLAVVLSAPSQFNLLSDSSIEATSREMASIPLYKGLPVVKEALWLTQGSSWYLQDIIPFRAGIWGARATWDRFYHLYDVYRGARSRYSGSIALSGSEASQGADASAMLCCGGASASAVIDSELQEQQIANRDLASFLSDLASLDPDEPLTNDDIQEYLGVLTGMDWDPFFRDYIAGVEEIPASSFSSLIIVTPETSQQSAETPQGETSTSGWILLGLAVAAVFLIPFILEPYTLSPRKPRFREKMMKDD